MCVASWSWSCFITSSQHNDVVCLFLSVDDKTYDIRAFLGDVLAARDDGGRFKRAELTDSI